MLELPSRHPKGQIRWRPLPLEEHLLSLQLLTVSMSSPLHQLAFNLVPAVNEGKTYESPWRITLTFSGASEPTAGCIPLRIPLL